MLPLMTSPVANSCPFVHGNFHTANYYSITQVRSNFHVVNDDILGS